MASHVKKRRVLVIMHESLVPPPDSKSYTFEERQEFRTEDDVVTGLRELGHEVQTLGLSDSLTPLRQAIREWQPHVVFNLLDNALHASAPSEQVRLFATVEETGDLRIEIMDAGPGIVSTGPRASAWLGCHETGLPGFGPWRRSGRSP